MTQKEKANRYDEVINKLRRFIAQGVNPLITMADVQDFFPELAESEDEKIRNDIIALLHFGLEDGSAVAPGRKTTKEQAIAWLEKQSNTNETINNDEFVQGVLRGAAINLITWIDYNAADGNMCLSNTECKDIEDALVSGDWNKIYTYMKKKLERQDKQKHIFDFNANNWYVSKVDGKIHNIYNSGVEPKFSEKKELKKIENFPILSNSAKTGKNWSEEDEIGSDETIELLEYFINYASEFRKSAIRRSIDWLESLKKRMGV